MTQYRINMWQACQHAMLSLPPIFSFQIKYNDVPKCNITKLKRIFFNKKSAFPFDLLARCIISTRNFFRATKLGKTLCAWVIFINAEPHQRSQFPRYVSTMHLSQLGWLVKKKKTMWFLIGNYTCNLASSHLQASHFSVCISRNFHNCIHHFPALLNHVLSHGGMFDYKISLLMWIFFFF